MYMYNYTNVTIFKKDANDVQISVVLFRVFHNMLILFCNYRMKKQQQSLILIIHIGRWCMKSTRLDYQKQLILRFLGQGILLYTQKWNMKDGYPQYMIYLNTHPSFFYHVYNI